MSSIDDLRNVLFGVAEDTGRLTAATNRLRQDIEAVQAKVNHAIGNSHNDASQQALASLELAHTDLEQINTSIKQAYEHISTYMDRL